MITALLHSRKLPRSWRPVAMALMGVGGIVVITILEHGRREEVEPSSQRHPDSLVGTWLRIYPASPRRVAIILRGDGTAVGQTLAVSAYPLEWISEWGVGSDPSFLGPTDLCFSNPRLNGGTQVCSGWILKGDTLALANGQNTVLLRAAAFAVESAGSDSAPLDDRSRFGPVPAATRSPVHNRR